MTEILYDELEALGIKILTKHKYHFDTLAIDTTQSGFSSSDYILAEFHKFGINLRKIDQNLIGISLNETTSINDLSEMVEVFADLLDKSDPDEGYLTSTYFENL